jgi:hypothetical protein
MMFTARAATTMIVTSETMLSNIINNLARDVTGRASVGLSAGLGRFATLRTLQVPPGTPARLVLPGEEYDCKC